MSPHISTNILRTKRFPNISNIEYSIVMGYNKVLTLYIPIMENKDKLLPIALSLTMLAASCKTLDQKSKVIVPDPLAPQTSQLINQPTELPKEDPTTAPIAYVENEKESENTPENLQVDAGIFGVYRTYWNEDLQLYTLAFNKDHQVKPGEKTLEDLRKDGGSISLVTPYEVVVNCSGGANDKFYVDEDEWNLGNPAESEDGDFVVQAGQEIKGVWEAGNDSAGLELHFPKTGTFEEEYPRVVRLDIQTEQEQKEFTPQDFLVNLQELGTYKFGLDKITNTYVLQIAKKHLVAEGTLDLEDVKQNGGKFIFSLPWNITLNSIVGQISANGEKLMNGNPAVSENGVYNIPANQLIEVTYEAYNPNNGFQINIEWPTE